jgi:hypothetical protein
MNKGLGRLIKPDIRNLNYPVRRAMAIEPPKTGRKLHFDNGWWGDQGPHPHCVGYAAVHLLEDGPVVQRRYPPPLISPIDAYMGAQNEDEWEGVGYDGTSANGVCKWLQKKGIIKNWYWAFTLEEAITALFEKPLLFGQSWYADMNNPNEEGFVTPTGAYEGGHETVINGIDLDEGWVRLKNSWGKHSWTNTPTWGKGGHYYMTIEDFDKLRKDYGDIAYVDEVKNWREIGML